MRSPRTSVSATSASRVAVVSGDVARALFDGVMGRLDDW